jgi:hypothetical protein
MVRMHAQRVIATEWFVKKDLLEGDAQHAVVKEDLLGDYYRKGAIVVASTLAACICCSRDDPQGPPDVRVTVHK